MIRIASAASTAALVLLTGAVALGIILVISVIKTIVLFVLIAAVVVAVLWALKTIVW